MVKIKLQCPNWNAWRTGVVRWLRVNSCQQCIRMDGGVAQEFEDMLYERSVEPVAILLNTEGIMVDLAFIAK